MTYDEDDLQKNLRQNCKKLHVRNRSSEFISRAGKKSIELYFFPRDGITITKS